MSGSPPGVGCRNSCLIHLIMMGVLGLAMLIWAVRNRAWELEVTVELPENSDNADSADYEPPNSDEKP